MGVLNPMIRFNGPIATLNLSGFAKCSEGSRRTLLGLGRSHRHKEEPGRFPSFSILRALLHIGSILTRSSPCFSYHPATLLAVQLQRNDHQVRWLQSRHPTEGSPAEDLTADTNCDASRKRFTARDPPDIAPSASANLAIRKAPSRCASDGNGGRISGRDSAVTRRVCTQ